MKAGVVLKSELDSDLRERSRLAGATYISPIDAMCNEEGCITRVGDNLDDIVTWDGQHLTVAGSIYLVDRFPGALFGDSKSKPTFSQGKAPDRTTIDQAPTDLTNAGATFSTMPL
jgi:hypothetical protein